MVGKVANYYQVSIVILIVLVYDTVTVFLKLIGFSMEFQCSNYKILLCIVGGPESISEYVQK